MQELEKILEEIEQRKARAEKLIVKPPHDKLDQVANDTAEAFIEAYKECQDIIRNHMNDGWVPVWERLPQESGFYLVQLSKKLPNEDYSDRVVVLYSGEDKKFMCYSRLIVAWHPLPNSYRPERSKQC